MNDADPHFLQYLKLRFETDSVAALNQWSLEFEAARRTYNLEYCRRLLQAMRQWENLSPDNIAQIKNAEGMLYQTLSNWERAKTLHQDAIKLFDAQHNQSGLASALNNLGLDLIQQSDYTTATEVLEASLIASEQLQMDEQIARVCGNLALCYRRTERVSEAIQMAERALTLFRKVDNLWEVGRTLFNLGTIHYQQRNYSWALEYLDEDRAICEQFGDTHGLAEIFSNIGLIRYRQGLYIEADEALVKALRLFQQLNNLPPQRYVLNNLALVYEAQNRCEEALGWYEQVRALCEELQDHARAADVWNNMSECVGRLRGDDEALVCFQNAIAIREALGDRVGVNRAGYNQCRYLTERVLNGAAHLKPVVLPLIEQWLREFHSAEWTIGIQALEKLRADISALDDQN